MKKESLPRNKLRDMEVSPVQGNATRSFFTAPPGGSAQKTRGEGKMIKIKRQSIPNK